MKKTFLTYLVLGLALLSVGLTGLPTAAQTSTSGSSPSTYSGYTGTDVIVAPPPPALGPANSVLNDPVFGSRILRVTDEYTTSGTSFIPENAGFVRTFNANSTAIKLVNPSNGISFWLEFNPSAFTVGDGSSRPVPHQLPFNWTWEWSAVDPDVIYYLNGNQLAEYNKATGAMTNLGGPSNGDPVTYHVAVVGADNWVCSAAGSGIQDTYTEIFCIQPSNASNFKFINVPNKTINGIVQLDPNWPTAVSGQTLGIHSLDGSPAGQWLDVAFRNASWGGNQQAVLNLNTNTWSLMTNADIYWSGHTSLGNGKYVNGAGSINGMDARGALVRDPDDMMNSSKYLFIGQPPTTVGWYSGEHNSWHNSASNPNAPVLFSRYGDASSPWLTWSGEIYLAAVDGSNTVWRIAHNYNSGSSGCFYGEAFAEISNDGNWATFSSPWGGTLGTPAGGDCPTRIDTFIVELAHSSTPPTIAVSVSPNSATVASAGTQQFTATVTGSTNTGVTWAASNGTISSSGLYTAPTVSANTTATVTATSVADTTKSASASVTIVAPLIISSVSASNISSSGALITWATSTASDSQVDYGLTTAYGSSTPLNSSLLTAHAVTLTGLQATTAYHYRVKSRDAAGNLATSADFTFTTLNASSGSGGGVQNVVWTSLVNVTATGNSLQKTSGCDGCADAGAVSSQTITSGDGYMEFTASETTTARGIGLSNGNPGTSLAEISFALLLSTNGYATVYEKGGYKTEATYVTGDVFRVAVVSGQVRYSKNGTVFYTSAVAPTYPLLVDTTLWSLYATLNNVVISVASSTTTSDTTPPTVSLTAPSPGATVSGTITVSANATDNVGVASVQFQLDGANLGAAVTTAPYAVSWNTTTATNAAHTLTAVARDAAGNSTTSAGISVTVSNSVPSVSDTTPPSVSITAPANGATLTKRTTINVAGTDNVGVQTIQVYGDSKLLGTVNCAGSASCTGSVTWSTNGLARGAHTISAVAMDTSGNSSSTTITVQK